MNRLITFEGIDGSGKSTQIKLLREKFREMHIQHVSVREPGSTTVSEQIRNILLDKNNYQLSVEAESLLFMAARAQITSEVIIPALKRDEFVICDRYIDSTIAYQGYGRGMEIPFLETINRYATRNILPGLTIIIDIPKELSLNRRILQENDRMEAGGADFLSRVIKGYHQVSRSDERFVIIKGDQSPEKVFDFVWESVTRRFGELNEY